MNSALNYAIGHLKSVASNSVDNSAKGIVALVDDAAEIPSTYLIAPAAGITSAQVLAMVNLARGVVCAAISEARISELGLPPMTAKAKRSSPQFLVSVEARQGVTTGISADDRAQTLRVLAETTQPRRELVTPGHIFPLLAKSGGVLVKNTIAEGAVDLMTLASLAPTAAICRCLDEDGSLLSKEKAISLAKDNEIPITSISDIIEHRLSNEAIIEEIAEANLPIKNAGQFRALCFRSLTDGAEHLALVKGKITQLDDSGKQDPVLVRVQAERRLGDLFDLNGLKNRAQIAEALAKINSIGRGVFVYVRHPGKSPKANQNRNITPTTTKTSTASALREFGIGAQILNHVGANRVILLSHSGREVVGADVFNLEILGHEKF